MKRFLCFLKNIKFFIIIGVIIFSSVVIYFQLEENYPNSSNNATLIVEIVVGIIISIFVYRTSKKTQHRVDAILDSIHEKVDLDYQSSSEIKITIHNKIRKQISNLLKHNVLFMYDIHMEKESDLRPQDKQYELLYNANLHFGQFNDKVEKIYQQKIKSEEEGLHSVLYTLRRCRNRFHLMVGICQEIQKIQMRHSKIIDPEIESKIKSLLDIFYRKYFISSENIIEQNELHFLSWYAMECTVHCSQLLDTMDKIDLDE